MPLPASFDKLDDIPDAFRSGYVEKDGKYVLDDSDVRGLKANSERWRKQKETAEAALRDILGDRTADDVKAALAKLKEDSPYRDDDKPSDRASDKNADAGRWAEREKKLRDEFDARLKPLMSDREKLQQKEFDERVWDAAKAAGALESDRKMVLKMARDDYVTRDTNGKIVVLDEYGESTGDDLKTLFEGRFKKDNAKLYASAGGSGGGASQSGSASGRGRSQAAASDMSDFVARITSDKDALAKAKTGQFGVRAE